MTYTEIKERNGKKYFYRVLSVRNAKKIHKKRIYLGRDLDSRVLHEKEALADKKFKAYKITESIRAIKEIILRVLKKYNIKKASIFGSYARGEQTKKSDIDILIEPSKDLGLEFIDIAFDLEKNLGKKVDLVTYKGISPHLKKYILEDEVRVL